MPRQQGSASEGGVVPDETKKSQRTFRFLFRSKKSSRELDAVSSRPERSTQDEVPVLNPITPPQAAAPLAPGPSTSADHSQTVAPGPSAAATGAGSADAGPDAPDSPAAPRAAAAAASSGQAVLPVSSQTLHQAGRRLPDQLAPAGAHFSAQSTAQSTDTPLQAEGVNRRVNAPSVVQDDLARAAARRAKQAAAPAAQPTSPDGSPLRPMQAASPAALPGTQTLQQGWVAVTPQQSPLPDQHSQTAPRQLTAWGLHDYSALSEAPQVGRPIVPTDEEMALLDTGDTTWNHIILQHTNLARRSAPLEHSPAGVQVKLVKHPEAHTTPVQAQSRPPRASLAQDNPCFEEDRTPVYSQQQENPLFEEGQGLGLPGGVPGAPQHWTSDLKPGPLRERFQPVSPPEHWAGMVQTEAWQPGPSTFATATTTAAAQPAATAGPSTAGRLATSASAAAAPATSAPETSEAAAVPAQHTRLHSEDWEVLRVSDQPILTGGVVEHRPPALATESTAQSLQSGPQQQETGAAGATMEHPLTDLGSQAGPHPSDAFVETASESNTMGVQEREGGIEEPGTPGERMSNTQPEEQAAEGANKSGRPSKQEQPYSATRVSTLAAQWEQAQAGRQVAAGPPAGDEPHQAATATATAAQQPSASDPQKDMASHAAAEGEAASRPVVQLGQLRMSRTQILPKPAQQTEARPEAPAGTRQVQASAQQELGAAAGHEVRDWQRQGGHSDAQAPQATAADAHDHDLWQRQRQQQQTQAEQPSAAEAPAVQQEGLLQGPQGPLGPDGPQKGALQGAHGPQAEQRAEQSAATTAAFKQDARGERPRAAASGGRASPAAVPVRAEAPPQGATADTELAAAGSAQAAAAGSAARASVLAALASTPADAAAVNAAWESAAAAAEQRPPTAAERRQTPTPAAPATTSQPASHRRVSSEPSATALPPRPQVRAAETMAVVEKPAAGADKPSLTRTSGNHVGGDWGPPSRESSVGGREYPAGPPPSPTASEQRLVHQQTFWRQQDHPILVERTTRLQQPLQYEREYVAETRLTGRRRAADGQPVADEVLRSAEEHLEEGQGGGSSLRGVPDQYQGFFKAGPLESPRPPDHMQSDVLVTPEIEVEVPMETSSAPRLADVWVRVPAAAAPAPAVAEERVRIAVRQRPPEVIDDEDQSPRYDPAALKFGPAVYIAELLPAGQRADALQPLGHDRSDTARIKADVLGAVRRRASAGSGLGKQPLAEPCAPITSGPLGVATPVSPPLASTGVGASTSRAPPTAMRVPAPAAVRVQVPQRERRESVRLFLGDPDNSPRYDPAARRHGEDVYPVLATGVPVAADSPKYDPAARKYGTAMYGAPFTTPQAHIGVGVGEIVADTAGTGEAAAEDAAGFAPEGTAPEPSPAGMSLDSIGKPATPEAMPPAFAVPHEVLPAPSPVPMAVPYAEERAFAARQSRGLASPSRGASVEGAAGTGARKRPRWGWLDDPRGKPQQSRQAPLWGTGAMQEEFSMRPASPLPQRRAASMQPVPARWTSDLRAPAVPPWQMDGSTGLYSFGAAPVARGKRRQDADMVQWEMAEAFELQYISAQAG